MFVSQEVWGMVGAYHADTSVGDGLSQRLPVVGSLYGRITLYACPFGYIVLGRKHQVGYDSFGGDVVVMRFE